MPVESAGIALFRPAADGWEIFLVHNGGPFFAKKDDGAWSIPKGLIEPGEDPLTAARREFVEETGLSVPVGDVAALGTFRQPGGKLVHAFALAGDLDLAGFRSETFTLEWPPRSGRVQEFPEVDRGEWFPPDMARRKASKGQVAIVDALTAFLSGRGAA